MDRINLRPNPALAALCAGIVLGAALGAGGCARAERAGAPPVLPAARVDYTRPRATRQVIVAGELKDVERRANTLLLEGWRALPGLQISASGHAVLVLEWKPGLLKGP